MRHALTPKQVEVLRPMYERMRQAEREWQAALVLLGLEGSDLTGGDLEADEPYLETSETADDR